MNSDKIRVLVTIPSGFCFGLQHISIDLFANAKDRIEPHFLITRWNNGDFKKLVVRHGFTYSFSWLGMFSRKLDGHNLRMSLIALSKLPRLYFDFLKLYKQKRPDILFFANHHELLLLLPVLWFIKRKIVCHMHDPSPLIPFQKKTFSWYGKRVDHFIAISEDVRKRLIGLGCPIEKISVVHNGIHIPSVKSNGVDNKLIKQFGWPEDSFILGLTGQMTVTKGHADLLEAFSIAIQQNPKLRLVFGGKKSEPLFSQLNEQIEKKGLTRMVGFSGWMEEVGEFYRNIDLFILASRHDEGYGLVVAESMAYGKPVIITDSGGAVEIVENEINGYIIPKQDSKAMGERILILSTNPILYRDFSIKALHRVEKNFTIQHSAARFSALLQSILQ